MNSATKAYVVYVISGTVLAGTATYAVMSGHAAGASITIAGLYFVTLLAATIVTRGGA